MIKLFIFCLLLSLLFDDLAFAEDKREGQQMSQMSLEDRQEEAVDDGCATSRLCRERDLFGVNGHFASFSTWVPFKYGLSLSFNFNDEYTFDPEYHTGSVGLKIKGVNLASFSETLILLPLRWFVGNSFHFKGGVGQRSYRLVVGDELLTNVASTVASEDLSVVRVKSNVIDFAIANRWQFSNGFVFGVEWFEIFFVFGDSQVDAPLIEKTTSEEDRDNVKKVVEVLSDLPTFGFLKMHIGYSF